MRWGSCVFAATSILAGSSCLRAHAATDMHTACGTALSVPEPIRFSVLAVLARHRVAAACAARPAAAKTIIAQSDSCEQDPTDPTCVCMQGETDADCVGGVHRG